MIKKIALFLIIAIFVLSLALYFLFFSKEGNKLLRPFLQDYIQTYSKDLELLSWRLTLDALEAELVYKDFLDLKIFGDFSLFKQTMDLNLVGNSKSIQNAFRVRGSIVGDFKDFLVRLNSNVGLSKSIFAAEFRDRENIGLFLDIKHMELQEILPFFDVDGFARGKIDMHLSIDKREFLEGDLTLKLSDVSILGKFGPLRFFNQVFKSKANGEFSGVLREDDAFLIKGSLKSPLYALHVDEGILGWDVLELDYDLEIPSVRKINPSIRRDFSISGKGKIVSPQQSIDFESQSFGGKVFANFQQSQLKIDFDAVQTDYVLALLNIPQNFLASFSGSLDYGLISKTGVLQGEVKHLTIRRNSFFDLLYRYTGFNIQDEKFRDTNLYASVNKNFLEILDFSIQGDHIGIASNKMFLNLANSQIDAPLKISIQKSALQLRLKGLVSSPQVEFKLHDILRLDKKDLLDHPFIQKGMQKLLDELL